MHEVGGHHYFSELVSRYCGELWSAAQGLAYLLQCLDPHTDRYINVKSFKTMQNVVWTNYGHGLCICIQDSEGSFSVIVC